MPVTRNALCMIQKHTQQHGLLDHAATLERAAASVGGYAELAARLKVSQQQLEHWIGEEETPPHTVFLDAIDIIIENALRRHCRNAGVAQTAMAL
jgi:hypothetical protein